MKAVAPALGRVLLSLLFDSYSSCTDYVRFRDRAADF